MCLEFDSQCCTIQAEDTLQLYIPSSRLKTHGFRHPSASCDYLPVFSKFSGSDNWPASSLILPGMCKIEAHGIARHGIAPTTNQNSFAFPLQATRCFFLWKPRPIMFEVTRYQLGVSAAQLLATNGPKRAMPSVFWKLNWPAWEECALQHL